MLLELHPDAEADILEAADWYDIQSPGLGDDLLAEVDDSIAVVLSASTAWPRWPKSPPREPPIQRFLLPRFRYFALAYQSFPDRVVVLALVHQRRRPFFWLQRAR